MPHAGLGSAYSISTASDSHETANRFLAFLFDPANASYWVEQMAIIPPYNIEAGSLNVSPLMAETMQSLDTGGMGLNIDVLTPEPFNTTMLDGFQAMLSEERTAAEQAAALQASVAE